MKIVDLDGAGRFADEEPPDDGNGVSGSPIATQYVPIDWHELWNNTSSEPDWLVPDILERGRLTAIFAPKKTGKSLLTLLLLAALATGRSLLGRPNPHGRKIRVLYIDLENAGDDIRQRLEEAGYQPDDLAELIYFSFPALPPLDGNVGGMHLVALAEYYQPDLIVLDTTSRVVKGEENSADTFRDLYRHALSPLKARGIAVLRLDHAGKDINAGQRGSSAKGEDLDTAWLLVARGQDRFTLRRDLQRTNHHPETVELMLHAAPLRFVRFDDAGERPEVTTLVAHLDRLGVPYSAGRGVARKALTDAGIKTSDGYLAEAVKIRKTCAEPSRTGPSGDDLYDEEPGGADTSHSGTETAGETCSAQVPHRSHSSESSNSDATCAESAVSRSAQPSAQSLRTGAEQAPGCRTCGQRLLTIDSQQRGWCERDHCKLANKEAS